MENTAIKKRSFLFTDNFRELIHLTICLICMFLFLFSAYEKIIDHEIFYAGLAKVAVIRQYAGLIAWIVPIIEILVSIILIIPQTQKWGLISFASLMGIFTFYILNMWLWADKLPCHCNLIIDKLTWGQHIWFNIVFIGLAIFAIKLPKNKS